MRSEDEAVTSIDRYDDVDVFSGLDVGKGEHHAVALDRSGKRLFDRALPNDEGKLRAVLTQLREHGLTLLVVDQPATSGALPVAVAQAEGALRHAPRRHPPPAGDRTARSLNLDPTERRTQRASAATRRDDLNAPSGIIGTARPANAIRGQKLLDTTADTIPTSAKTIAIDHTTTLNHVGTADCFVLLMPRSIVASFMRPTKCTRRSQRSRSFVLDKEQ